MAKNVSGKAVLITNVFILVLGIILILIIVATMAPPAGTDNAGTSKFVTLNFLDIIGHSVAENNNIQATITIYNGGTVEFEKIRQIFLFSQQNQIINFYIVKGDLLTVTLSEDSIPLKTLNYTFGTSDSEFDLTNRYFISWDAITPEASYISRNILSFKTLDSVTGDALVANTDICYKMIDSDTITIPLAQTSYMYRSEVTSEGKDYSFKSIHYGLPLNTTILIDDVNPLVIDNLNTTQIISLKYGTSSILQVCCGTEPCGITGTGTFDDLNVTAEEVCTASLL